MAALISATQITKITPASPQSMPANKKPTSSNEAGLRRLLAGERPSAGGSGYVILPLRRLHRCLPRRVALLDRRADHQHRPPYRLPKDTLVHHGSYNTTMLA